MKYAEGYTAIVRPPKFPRGQGADGYGNKIATQYMLHFPGDPPNRLYRVYCICYSNVGTHYIIRKGENHYLRGYELEEALGR